MRWLVYSIAVSLLASGSLVASSKSTLPESAEQERPQTQAKDEDFVPSEKVPADSAISFPVDI